MGGHCYFKKDFSKNKLTHCCMKQKKNLASGFTCKRISQCLGALVAPTYKLLSSFLFSLQWQQALFMVSAGHKYLFTILYIAELQASSPQRGNATIIWKWISKWVVIHKKNCTLMMMQFKLDHVKKVSHFMGLDEKPAEECNIRLNFRSRTEKCKV